MVYQLLKDIEQLLGGKESLTAAEQSILERSSKVIATMRNPEDTELLKRMNYLSATVLQRSTLCLSTTMVTVCAPACTTTPWRRIWRM